MSFRAKYDPGVHVAGEETLALHRNENLFVGAEWTVDVARRLVGRAAIATYPDATSRPLREALAELYGVTPENVFVGNGSDEVLADLLGFLRRRFDAFSTLDVSFKVYPLLAERMDYAVETLAGNTFETGHVDPAGFRGLAVVDSPNGITGSSLDPAELSGLARDPDSFLIYDNAYGEYAGHELPRPCPANVACVRTFSKFYGLAGLRVGYCIADAGLVAELLARKDAFNVGGFAQVMALEALRRRDWFAGLRDELVASRRLLVAGLEELGFRVRPSDSVAVFATHPEVSGERLQADLLARGVAVRRFATPPTSDFVRVTVPPAPVRERFLAILAGVLGAG